MSEAIGDKEKEKRFVRSTWDKIIKAADLHYDLENLQLSLHTNIHLHYLMVDTITGTSYLKIIQFQKKLIRCLMHIRH